MTYIVNIDQRSYSIDINKQQNSSNISLNGNHYTFDWRQIAALAADGHGHRSAGGQYSLLLDGKSYHIFARCLSQADQKDVLTYEIQLAGQSFRVTVEDERSRTLAALTKSKVNNRTASIEAPMPGLVAAILCEQDTRVEQGQPIIVLEAMKMENDLVSPIAGTIKQIMIDKGQVVEQGALLVLVEAD